MLDLLKSLTTLQMVLLAVAGVALIISIIFMAMFIVEITVSPKQEKSEQTENKNVVNITKIEVINTVDKKDGSVKAMIESIENQTKEENEKNDTEDEVEESKEEDLQSKIIIIDSAKKENEEAIAPKTVEETVEIKEEVVDEKVESKEEKESTAIENFASIDEDDDNDDADDEDDEILLSNIEELKSETHETINSGSVIDYKTRLDKIVETKEKIEKDLKKIQKSILKYERTKRRKNRNQKMLDRRAGELTNLNLVMYSVTDIKNVDEDKKIKQEELTAHIAELKASIQDADEFIESNKEKNEHNVKMAKFLIQERSRYNDEIEELKALIDATSDQVSA